MDTENLPYESMNDDMDSAETDRPATIKVIGVGGIGCAAVSFIALRKFHGAKFVCIDTDTQVFNRIECDTRVAIGCGVTRGLGAMSDPAIGRAAIEENKENVLPVVQDADMIFITAGMGGSTGTGAAPLVAKMAQEANALTVAVVTKPFSFEGSKRERMAEAGIEELSKFVDAIIVIPNDNIRSVVTDDLTRTQAFTLSSNALALSVLRFLEVLTSQDVDFADVQICLKKSGTALLGVGEAQGNNRAIEAARKAISSPLWESDIHDATRVLFNVVASDTFTMKELVDVANEIPEAVDPDAGIFFGTIIDNSMGDKLRITIVATGFPNN
ncbi:MAG: cell division protein FtsZ [bacterium]|nr:cell division protein FtsZ [bacterium]